MSKQLFKLSFLVIVYVLQPRQGFPLRLKRLWPYLERHGTLLKLKRVYPTRWLSEGLLTFENTMFFLTVNLVNI